VVEPISIPIRRLINVSPYLKTWVFLIGITIPYIIAYFGVNNNPLTGGGIRKLFVTGPTALSKIFDFLEEGCGRLRALPAVAHSAGREEKFPRRMSSEILEFQFFPAAAAHCS
jgi:hypothetical protein